MHYVTTYKFELVMVRISTEDNSIADFISRNYNREDIELMFMKKGLSEMKRVEITDEMFNFKADW